MSWTVVLEHTSTLMATLKFEFRIPRVLMQSLPCSYLLTAAVGAFEDECIAINSNGLSPVLLHMSIFEAGPKLPEQLRHAHVAL